MIRRSCIALAVVGLTAALAAAGEDRRVPVGATVADFTLKDTNDNPRRLSDFRDAKAVVLAFLGTECPQNNAYLPRLAELAKKYEAKGVAFLGVNANSQDTLLEVTQHARTYQVLFPVCKDFGNKVADLAGATRTPEVVVLDAKHAIRYRGRIDDQFGFQKGQGFQRPRATRHDLADALDAVLAGKDVAVTETEVTGCLIGREASGRDDAAVTYARDVAPILFANCVSCHRPGQIGPFALLSYEQAKGWGPMIREVVQERRMPPWHADPKFGHFRNNRALKESEIDTLVRWVDSGMPRGDAKDEPKPPSFAEGWVIGEPDVVFKMKEPYRVPAEGVVSYQYFTLVDSVPEDIRVQAVEVRPGNRAVVHHILMYVVPPGTGRLSEEDRAGFFGAYAPGNNPMVWPEGTGKTIKKGSRVVFQIHYTPNGTAQTDQSYVGLIKAKKPFANEVFTLGVADPPSLQLPPGAADVKITAKHRFTQDVDLLALMPHTHLRGKAFRYEAHYPDGKKATLLDVPRYDFNWQTSYLLDKPVHLPKGSVLYCEARYDNSANNPNNPDPKKLVRWGDQTWDEMMIGYFDYLPSENRAESPGGDEARERLKAALDNIFKQFDKNGDGRITKDEVPEARRAFFERLLERFDGNNDGVLNKEEALKALEQSQQRR